MKSQAKAITLLVELVALAQLVKHTKGANTSINVYFRVIPCQVYITNFDITLPDGGGINSS